MLLLFFVLFLKVESPFELLIHPNLLKVSDGAGQLRETVTLPTYLGYNGSVDSLQPSNPVLPGFPIALFLCQSSGSSSYVSSMSDSFHKVNDIVPSSLGSMQV